MILLVNKDNRRQHAKLLNQSFALRKRVFADRLKWQVSVTNGLETDAYDDLDDTLYLLHAGADGTVTGCARLLPSMGPTMLENNFSALLDGHELEKSPTVWESTRFAVDHNEKRAGNADAGLVTLRLLAAMTETALAVGLTRILSVTDFRVERVLKQTGLPTKRLGKPVRMSDCIAVAGYFDPTPAVLDDLRIKAGLSSAPIILEAPWTRNAA